jgi:26S proteasome regulatory subunit N3
MPGKTPNGNEPVENGVRPNQDVDMKDDSTSGLKGKGKKAAKEGEDEMTVVVPPSKALKQPSALPPVPDADGDVAMGDEEKADDGEVKVDPVVQTVAGRCLAPDMMFVSLRD